MRKNRERALEIQRKRREEKGAQAATMKKQKISSCEGGFLVTGAATQKRNTKVTSKDMLRAMDGGKEDEEDSDDDGLPIEEFEEGASKWVTRHDALNVYCLPTGTLAVLRVEERENPHNKSWAPMKLYRRSEVRCRAHERWGGLEGLRKERERRREAKLAKDLMEANNIFKL